VEAAHPLLDWLQPVSSLITEGMTAGVYSHSER
jgi:hypothetical protein